MHCESHEREDRLGKRSRGDEGVRVIPPFLRKLDVVPVEDLPGAALLRQADRQLSAREGLRAEADRVRMSGRDAGDQSQLDAPVDVTGVRDADAYCVHARPVAALHDTTRRSRRRLDRKPPRGRDPDANSPLSMSFAERGSEMSPHAFLSAPNVPYFFARKPSHRAPSSDRNSAGRTSILPRRQAWISPLLVEHLDEGHGRVVQEARSGRGAAPPEEASRVLLLKIQHARIEHRGNLLILGVHRVNGGGQTVARQELAAVEEPEKDVDAVPLEGGYEILEPAEGILVQVPAVAPRVVDD
ncbi:MAG: hypothetical protein MZV64_09715 [Ignavibacteriales bacterium]|nr:hypothetical protein [Ignavibacteriales bacterium]